MKEVREYTQRSEIFKEWEKMIRTEQTFNKKNMFHTISKEFRVVYSHYNIYKLVDEQ